MQKIITQSLDKLKGVYSDKRALSGGKISMLVGALIFIVLVTALGPTMFEGLNITGAPTWGAVVLPIIVMAGLVMAVWKMFD